MKLLILVEIEGLPHPPDLLEEMLRHLILWESKGASILFYTSNNPTDARENLIDLAPSIISKRTIFPILSTRNLATLDDPEIVGVKYNTVMSCIDFYNKKHPNDPIDNYRENVVILDSNTRFISYISKHANRFTAFHINNETHTHRYQLANLYNRNLLKERSAIEPLKQFANNQQQSLKNNQNFLHLRYEQVTLEIENVIAESIFSFLQTVDESLQKPEDFETLKTHCYKHLDTIILTEIMSSYKYRLRAYGEASVKNDANLYELLIFRQMDSAQMDESLLEKALKDYHERVIKEIAIAKAIINASLSYTELLAKYTSLTEETAKKLDEKVTETALSVEEIDHTIKTIKKEYDETVGARKQDILLESMLYTGDKTANAPSVDPYELAFATCRKGELLNLKIAISAVADFKINRLNNGKSLLGIACEYAYSEIVRYLINEKNADVNSTLSARMPIFSALHGLKQYPNRVELLQVLLEKGAHMGPDVIDCEGNTPLHVAAQQANVKAFQLIALWITGHQDSCHDLCATNKAGRTALLEAIYADNFSTRLPIIDIMFTLGVGISKDEIEMLSRDGKLKLDIMKDVTEKYFLLTSQPRRDSIVSPNDRLTRTRNLSGPSLTLSSANNSSKDITGKYSANMISLPTMPTTPRQNSFIDSASAAATATSSATPQQTPTTKESSSLTPNLALTLSTNISSSLSAPGTPRARLPLDTLRDSPSISSPRNSSGGTTNEQNRLLSQSIKNIFNLFSPRHESPSKQPTTLFEAVRTKNYEALKTMLKDLEMHKKRSEANLRGDDGTALYEAVILADKEAIKCFYEAGLCLSKIEIQMLLSDANIRSESVRAFNEVIQNIRRSLNDNSSPRPEKRRTSILHS